MDSAALRSLTPLLDGIDQWVELAPLLPVIISLELILSADNAIALASITRRLKSKETQKIALNIGILLSLVLRVILILMAQVVLRLWPIKLIASIYLLGLCFNKFRERFSSLDNHKAIEEQNNNISLIKTIFLLALTDLAFSIDSVAAAVAISDQFLLVISGAIIGVIALRFTSGLFIKWLDEFIRLELAGYIAVGLIGLKLLIILLSPSLVIPEWFVFLSMILLFIWGFSKRNYQSNYD
ncbi:TerC family protein [Prochlorococcus sp. MIT 1307]|uniref:TerC family protein n=1 Tax=Prochlorococcus sp. MIT 1307 TaxID=3096219 RepID=UPI002A75D7A6|nr:hypothetical protein [Prochlorococcus sp. MIT 1307]